MTKRRQRHHYVPTFYLRRFADQKGRLDAYRRTSRTRLKVAVANAAVQHSMYEVVDTAGELSDIAEVILADIESQVAPGLDALISGPWPPKHEVRGQVANFVAMQLTRTREYFHFLTATMDRMRKHEMSFLTRGQWRQLYVDSEGEQPSEEDLDAVIADFHDFESWSLRLHPNLLVEAMFEGASTLVQPIASRKWFLQVSKKPLLVTSDNPIQVWSRPERAAYGVGVFTADELWLPIDSRHSLLMVYDSFGRNEQRLHIERSAAKRLNQRLADSCYEWVFADPRRNALDMLQLPTGPRPLGTVGGEAIWGPGHGPRRRPG